MAEKKRKVRDETKHKSTKTDKKFNKKSKKGGDKRKKSGPRLPSALRKELDRINPTFQINSEEDEDIHSDEEGNDVYEYEEGVPEEESKKNHRYDHVQNYEYELPEDFEDEDVESNNEDDDDDDDENVKHRHDSDDEMDDDDDERHSRMLQGITGMPSEAFEGKKKVKKNFVVSEAYPESEYNPSRGVLDGNDRITLEDLLQSLQGKSGYSELQKRTHQMARKTAPLHAPLPKVARDKLARRAAYDISKKDMSIWGPVVKRNRENPTIIFDQDTDLGFSTVGAIASEFEPRTDFEKKMASLVQDKMFMEAHREDGAKLLELNKISAEDYKKHRDHVAKMRSLLFRHEVKMKRIKKIKSKTFARKSKKDRLKLLAAEFQMDPEAAKELAMKQEFKRAEERMTLRHKNRSKWARRILERGLSVQDEGTREALSDQLNQHQLLTRKMNSMKDTSSSDDSIDEENDENSAGSDEDETSKALERAKQKTLKVLEEDDDVHKSGLFTLPFMERGLKKKNEAALEEAKLALQEYESLSNPLEDKDGAENRKTASVNGRRVFGTSNKLATEPSNKRKLDDNSGSGSEYELEAEEEIEVVPEKMNHLLKDVKINSALFNEDAETNQDSVFKEFDEIVKESNPKTTYEVSIFASDTWKKMKSQDKKDTVTKKTLGAVKPGTPARNLDLEDVDRQSDTESEGHMVDGILSSGLKNEYELPSQAELIHEAFAADDVEEEFTKDKEKILNEEVPEAEKPVLLPGWGQWTHVQKKKGLPSWMVEEHEIAKRKREEALKKRKDAHLKNVIISEKLDKKAEKLHTKTLPFPFTSKEVFEQSIRMPIGPEFNPATALRALNRPEVVKKAGVIIKPIKYEDVDPYNKEGEHKHKQKQRVRKNRSKLKPIVVKS